MRKILKFLHLVRDKIFVVRGYFLTYPFLKLLNIHFEGPPKFYGKIYIKLKAGSKVVVGKHCIFRSHPTSNYIGLNRRCYISTYTNEATINIGNNCGFSGTVIGAFMSVILKDNVRCGANTLITDSDWHLNDKRSVAPEPILINDNVWLGEGVKVLKGVTIGENTIIGAGSIVTSDIPANVIAAGNPCRVIKFLPTDNS